MTVVLAMKVKPGTGVGVSLSASGVMAVVSGSAWACASVITVTLLEEPLAT